MDIVVVVLVAVVVVVRLAIIVVESAVALTDFPLVVPVGSDAVEVFTEGASDDVTDGICGVSQTMLLRQ